ncbi:MAG: nucleotide exchange factor GrpE [Candidatus Daviesbacteria bacterium]|nr:nucleotide exchange factor GrpE [Candidatus Daviesbacteria bacterium]
MGKKQSTQTEEFKKLQDELDSVKELSIQMENQLKRAVADYHNLEKRVTEGRSELTKWGTGELLVKILPTLDHLEQALNGASEQERQSGWFKGVELAVKELNTVLQSEGLEQIVADPSTALGTGSQFDPNLHEAVDTQAGEDNRILKVVRKGYTLNSKILRPAAVVVGRNVIASEAKQSGPEEEKGETN